MRGGPPSACRKNVTRLVCLALLAALPGWQIQGQKPAVSDWPDIPADELGMKDDPSNPGARAIVLYREVMTDDAKYVESHYYRIKILTEEGRKYADIEIPYFAKAASIEEIRARVVQPDGKSTVFSGQVFDKLVVKARKAKFQAKTLTLPEARSGSVIEYKYLIRFHMRPPDVFKHPERYMIDTTVSTPAAHWIIPHELFTRRARFSIRPLPRVKLIWSSVGVEREHGPRSLPDGTFEMEVHNVPGFQEEEYMPPEDSLRARVDFFYAVGFLYDAHDYWAAYAKNLGEAIQGFLGDAKAVRRMAEETVAPADTPEAKLRKLYARAQQVRHLSFEREKTEQEEKRENLKANKSVGDLLKHGYASANEVNLLFVALARAAGFESAPVMVPSRDRQFFRANLLERGQLNAMVVWVQAGPKEYYLDPSTQYCPFGLVPWIETDTSGYRIEKTGGALVTTPASKSADAVIERKGSLQVDAEGNLEGKVQVTFRGQEALERRLEYREKDGEGRKRALEDEVKSWLHPGSTAVLISVSNWEEASETLQAAFTIRVPEYGSQTGRRLLLPVGIFQARERHFFQSAKRVHPVYFPFPYQELDEITLQLAPGQTMENTPGPRRQTFPFGRYEISCSRLDKAVRLERRAVLDGIYFKTESYTLLKAFYDGIRVGDEQQMVLQSGATASSAH